MTPDIPETYGALLIGALCSAGLSGILIVQVIVYFKLYPDDGLGLKSLVLVSWLFDLMHSGFMWATLWDYFIKNFGVSDQIAFIPLVLPITVLLTAISTFLVHCFFVHRIYLLSNRNRYIAIPIFAMAFSRLFCASVSSTEMIRLHTFNAFANQVGYAFTSGLALSSGADILITLSLFVLLRRSRLNTSRGLKKVIDSLILYTFEIGSLTAAVTIATMICWLTMDNNLIFMGLHFVIEKLYANSLLATLNSRHPLRQVPSGFTATDLRRNMNEVDESKGKRDSAKSFLTQCYRPRSGSRVQPQQQQQQQYQHHRQQERLSRNSHTGTAEWEFFKSTDSEMGTGEGTGSSHATGDVMTRQVSTGKVMKIHRGVQHDCDGIEGDEQ